MKRHRETSNSDASFFVDETAFIQLKKTMVCFTAARAAFLLGKGLSYAKTATLSDKRVKPTMQSIVMDIIHKESAAMKRGKIKYLCHFYVFFLKKLAKLNREHIFFAFITFFGCTAIDFFSTEPYNL